MNATRAYEFTIIVPLYDEKENLERLAERLAAYLPVCSRKACVLFVDDGSTDGSAEEIRRICAQKADFYYLSFARNRGLSAALKAGFDHCGSPLVGYIDADLQTAPEDFELLLAEIEGTDLVTGIRTGRQDSLSKKLQSRIANGWRRMMTGDGAVDTGCPLKVFRTEVARQLPLFRGMHRFFPALVLLREGGSYRQVPVRAFPRTAGKSKYHLWNRLWAPFIDCFAYRWMKKRYTEYTVKDENLL